MSPLFPCSRCGVQIERSVRLYRQQKGLVLCSTCKDRQEADEQGAARTAVNPEADPGVQ
jgi:transposase